LQLNQANDENDDTPMRDEVSEGRGPITLRRLLLWASEPMQTLKILCDALLFIMDARGGAVISALDRLRHHGDPRYQKVCKLLLANVSFSICLYNYFPPRRKKLLFIDVQYLGGIVKKDFFTSI
jgi:hypothetical protein